MEFAVARTRFANLMECLLFFCKLDGDVYVVAPCNSNHKVPRAYISGVALNGYDPDLGNFRSLLSDMQDAHGAPFKIAAATVTCVASRKNRKNIWRIRLRVRNTKRVFTVEPDKLPFMKDLTPDSEFWETVPSWDNYPEVERRELVQSMEKTRQFWNGAAEFKFHNEKLAAREEASQENAKRQRLMEAEAEAAEN